MAVCLDERGGVGPFPVLCLSFADGGSGTGNVWQMDFIPVILAVELCTSGVMSSEKVQIMLLECPNNVTDLCV